MVAISEGNLRFSFADGVQAGKYDEWSFYRNRFQNGCFRDNKAVDLVCKSDNTAWLIEVKDYRLHGRTKPIDLADEIAIKVRDSLAGIAAAQTQAGDLEEKKLARSLMRAVRVRVVCHIEQPTKASRLRPRAIEPDKLKQKLRSRLAAIDPHPIVMDRETHRTDIPWSVSTRGNPE